MTEDQSARAHVIQATLLYDSMPPLPAEKLRTELRALAGRRGLTTAGDTDFRDGVLHLAAEPFEIIVEAVEQALPAASFCGALSAHINSSLRRPLAEVVAQHASHLRIDLRDMRTRGARAPTVAQIRSATIFAQDVVRLVMGLMPPTALHWHPSNMLSLPMGLGASKEGTLFLPLCLRMRNTSSVIEESPQANFAQSIEGSAELLGRPLHVMSCSLDRFETLDLAIAFLGQVMTAEGGPVPGTVFRDRKGTRVEVVDHKPTEDHPAGLLALVELGQMEQRTVPVQQALRRDLVSARAKAGHRQRSRDLDANILRVAATLTDTQAEVLRRSVEKIDRDEAEAAQPSLPTREELKELRERAAHQTRNTPGER